MSNAASETRRQPSYRLHKPTGLGVVRINGRDIYLGKHGTPASHEAYARTIAEWEAGCGHLAPAFGTGGVTVAELAAAFWQHAEAYYSRPDGTPDGTLEGFRSALRPVARLYANTPADSFGPKALAAVRQEMIRSGWRRKNINRQVGRVKQVFKWGVAQELVRADVHHALDALAGLRKGKSAAKEGEPVKPVPAELVEAVRPFASRQVWALIQLQRLTGARSGELVGLRPVDIDMSDSECWYVRPDQHKTAHHGKTRAIPIGPQGQEVIRPFLPGRPVDAPLFSPKDADRERREERHAGRQTPMNQGNRPDYNGRSRAGEGKEKEPGDCYTARSFGRAISEACDRASPPPALAELEAVAEGFRREGMKAREARRRAKRERPDLVAAVKPWRAEHRWHPHQLRHNRATEVRAAFGVELARAVLGHSSLAATAIYAEADEAKAREVAVRMG